jgi:ATP-dependent Clp protease ATP-binding subunit ClpC
LPDKANDLLDQAAARVKLSPRPARGGARLESELHQLRSEQDYVAPQAVRQALNLASASRPRKRTQKLVEEWNASGSGSAEGKAEHVRADRLAPDGIPVNS